MGETRTRTWIDKLKDDPNFIAASTPGGIEAQEAAGQKSFVGSDALPREMQGVTIPELEALGFWFDADAESGEGLFVRCVLPPGWSKRATDHAMWSELLDAGGVKRAGLFYKAAFYDLKAFMYWVKP